MGRAGRRREDDRLGWTRDFTTRPELQGSFGFGVVASPHWLATAVAMSVLERGDGAFDAAAAGGFTLQVAEPHLNGPGGECPILVRPAATGEIAVVCGQGVAPAAAPERFAALGLDRIPGTGLTPAAVTGAFDAWMRMLGIDRDHIALGERGLQLGSRRLVHRRPVEFVAPDLEAVRRRGLHGPGLVDPVGDEAPLADRLIKRVAEGRLLDFEEAQRVANRGAVFGIGQVLGGAGAGRAGEAELDPVDVLQDAAPLAVDAAVALVCDHEVEVAGGEAGVLVDHGLKRGDGDALRVVDAPVRVEDVAGVVAQVLDEGVLRLSRERDPVHFEQDPRDLARLEEPFGEGGDHAGLARPRRHLDEELPSAERDFAAERLDAIEPVVAVYDSAVGGDSREVAPHGEDGSPPLQILLREDCDDATGVGVPVHVEKPDLVAVREEDEADAELLGVTPGLILRRDRVDAGALGLEDGVRVALPAAEDVIRSRAVRQLMLEDDADAVGDPPPAPARRASIFTRLKASG